MRTRLLLAAALTAGMVPPAAAQDYHFTKNLAAGERMEIANINGNIDVTRASGRTAEVIVTKIVKKGDGSMVKAIMEEGGSGMHVCTIYLNRDPNRHTCGGDNNNDKGHGRDSFEVEMRYVVHVPAGARLVVDDVNGSVTVTGADADSKINTVNGDIRFDGIGASTLETVNGRVIGAFTGAAWDGTMSVETVNGSVDLTFPADLSAEVSGEMVNGSVTSAFPITIEKGWGPKSFNGRIGAGGRKLTIETVNGTISLKKR
jgi:DUF4097 and DUF4098 domain-containing protein YvlB